VTDSQPEPPAIVVVEHVLWIPGAEWDAAVDHVAARFARASPIDVEAVHASGALRAQVAALTAWSDAAGVDLDRELGRFLDEHLSMYVRPNPAVTRAVRALASQRPVHLASALPARAAEAIARHAGCWRSAATLHAGLHEYGALDRTVATLGTSAVYAAPGELQDPAAPLLQLV
jgi:hypothetical protein